ncbi:hypothetical protein DM02DRAFT_621433 [Periconia macrospinosa]|uniref:Uncharacterized protein n=1 Tax=Periconia macrospinosa TaxID=97972 RepID=A0A2V1EE03_9PLEO|nr:hypothetical protein DM02DRAFT_621433 [Periconia macrospinosa]
MPPQIVQSSTLLSPASTSSPSNTPFPIPSLQTTSDLELRSTIIFGIFSTFLAALGLVFAALTLRFMYKYHKGQKSIPQGEQQMEDVGGRDVEMQMQMQRFKSVSRESTLREEGCEVEEDEDEDGE